MKVNDDEQFMQRCIELAQSGLGSVAPNPMTGCVIVHEAKVIGEGFHRRFGEPHAEANAIAAVIARHGEEVLAASSLYVNLEPCVHHGKTPPCTDLIIEKKIPKVFIGCVDPFEKVNGRGIELLRKNGVEVTTGVLQNECARLNRRFFTFHTRKRPYIILKFAQSKDGFLTHPSHRWISNAQSQRLVHKWRSEEQAILIGTRTAITDNPHLTVRHWKGKNPVRIVVGSRTLPAHLNLHNADAPTYVYASLEEAMTDLYNREIISVMVEGGATLLQSFIDMDLWDEARIIIGNKFSGEGVKAPVVKNFKLHAQEKIVDDELLLLNHA